jgi:hypothetical protein
MELYSSGRDFFEHRFERASGITIPRILAVDQAEKELRHAVERFIEFFQKTVKKEEHDFASSLSGARRVLEILNLSDDDLRNQIKNMKSRMIDEAKQDYLKLKPEFDETEEWYLLTKELQFLTTSLASPMESAGYESKVIRLFLAASEVNPLGASVQWDDWAMPDFQKDPKYFEIGFAYETAGVEALNSAVNSKPCKIRSEPLPERHLRMDDNIEMLAAAKFFDSSLESDDLRLLVEKAPYSPEKKRAVIKHFGKHYPWLKRIVI